VVSAEFLSISNFRLDCRMNLTQMFTDDQIAVLCCLGALTVCGLIAAISYHVGPAGREDRRLNRADRRITPESDLNTDNGQRRAA
jgi:hypothetical protein